MIHKLELSFEFEKIKEEFLKAWGNYPWSRSYPTVQSSVSVSQNEPFDLLAGCGGKMTPEREKTFSIFAPEYSHGYLPDFFNSLPFSIYRLRWMILFGKGCYSFHQDATQRLHIPIISNPESYFVFKNPLAFFKMEVGSIYLADTTKIHTAMNCHNDWRVHLVGCVDGDQVLAKIPTTLIAPEP